MKKMIFIISTTFSTLTIFAQTIKYDDGAINLSGNFTIISTWGKNNITYSFQNGTNDIAGNDEQNAIREAFRIWSDYANLNFTEVSNNGDISILWGTGNHGDGRPFDGINGTLAHAYTPDPDPVANINTPMLGDMHFDDDEIWTMAFRGNTSSQPIDLVTVAAHEIGHAIGLGHSNVTCALMNPFYLGSHRYLAQDDIDGVRLIYGTRSPIITNNLGCNGGNFSIRNIPTPGSVTWLSSNPSIATVSGPGAITWSGTSSGNVTLTARINLPCGVIINESIPISNIGIPAPPSISPYNFDASCGTFIEAYSTEPAGATGYIWNLNFGQTIQNLSGPYSNYFNSSPLVTNPQTGRRYFNYLTVQAQNSCGVSAPSSTVQLTVGPVPASCSSGGGCCMLRISPNPSNGFLFVETKDNSKFTQLKFVDRMGNVRKTLSVISSSSATTNISDLPPDVYRVQALINNKWSTEAFIKQ